MMVVARQRAQQRVQLNNYAATSTIAHAHQLWMRDDGFDPQGYLVATAAAAAAAEAKAAAARGGCGQ